MKYIITLIFALFAFCGLAFADGAEALADTAAEGSASLIGLVIAAYVGVVNLALSFFPGSKDSWWYKLLSWSVLRLGLNK